MSGETAAAGAPRLSLETISKPSSPVAWSEIARDRFDRRERRRLGRQPRQKALDGVGRALDLEQHPALVVQHEAAEPELGGEPEDVGAEADALDGALDPGADPAALGAH